MSRIFHCHHYHGIIRVVIFEFVQSIYYRSKCLMYMYINQNSYVQMSPCRSNLFIRLCYCSCGCNGKFLYLNTQYSDFDFSKYLSGIKCIMLLWFLRMTRSCMELKVHVVESSKALKLFTDLFLIHRSFFINLFDFNLWPYF